MSHVLIDIWIYRTRICLIIWHIYEAERQVTLIFCQYGPNFWDHLIVFLGT